MKKLIDYDEIISPVTGKKINMAKLLKDQAMAKAMLVKKYEFFNLLADHLQVIYTFEIPTQATDGTRLFVNPEFTDGLTIQGKMFVLAHEIMHCALDHMRRGKNHDHQLSNIAADYEVNYCLVNDGVLSASTVTNTLHALYDDKYANMAYEHIYALIPKGGNDKHQTGDNNQQGNQENQSGDQNQQGNGGGGNGNQQKQSADYVAGWNKALEDYKAGKLKL